MSTNQERLTLVLAGEMDEDALITGYDPDEIQPGIYGTAEDTDDWWPVADG